MTEEIEEERLRTEQLLRDTERLRDRLRSERDFIRLDLLAEQIIDDIRQERLRTEQLLRETERLMDDPILRDAQRLRNRLRTEVEAVDDLDLLENHVIDEIEEERIKILKLLNEVESTGDLILLNTAGRRIIELIELVNEQITFEKEILQETFEDPIFLASGLSQEEIIRRRRTKLTPKELREERKRRQEAKERANQSFDITQEHPARGISPESQGSSLPTLLERARGEVSELIGDIQEELTPTPPGGLGDAVVGAFDNRELIVGLITNPIGTLIGKVSETIFGAVEDRTKDMVRNYLNDLGDRIVTGRNDIERGTLEAVDRAIDIQTAQLEVLETAGPTRERSRTIAFRNLLFDIREFIRTGQVTGNELNDIINELTNIQDFIKTVSEIQDVRSLVLGTVPETRLRRLELIEQTQAIILRDRLQEFFINPVTNYDDILTSIVFYTTPFTRGSLIGIFNEALRNEGSPELQIRGPLEFSTRQQVEEYFWIMMDVLSRLGTRRVMNPDEFTGEIGDDLMNLIMEIEPGEEDIIENLPGGITLILRAPRIGTTETGEVIEVTHHIAMIEEQLGYNLTPENIQAMELLDLTLVIYLMELHVTDNIRTGVVEEFSTLYTVRGVRIDKTTPTSRNTRDALGIDVDEFERGEERRRPGNEIDNRIRAIDERLNESSVLPEERRSLSIEKETLENVKIMFGLK